MANLARVGDFCPNAACRDYGKPQSEQSKKNIKKFGKRKGKQRYQCKTCCQTFFETKGTIFYRRRVPEDEILETLALLAEGVRISSLSRAKGHKEDAILDWLRDAARHAEQVEEILLAHYRVTRGQLDALWSYVGNKGEKGGTPKPPKAASSGERR